ncbi:CHASE2 domain-containing protein [Neptunomonas sp.]|uniref:CHASE2 domain-containing protein n=1 Tax=Neptunomonas sp. TaxID=1971898 RepID=UPI003569680C
MNLFRQKDIGFLLCQAFVLLIAFVPAHHTLENVLYDLFIQEEQTPPPDNLVIIDIDDKSLEALGRWPWPRSLHAEMIQKLNTLGAAVIGYNIAFVEPDTSPDSGDAALKRSIATHGNVILPIFAERGSLIYPFRGNKAISGSKLGHVDIEVDNDGYVRRSYLKAGIDSPQWPAFGLSVLQGSTQYSGFLPGTRSPASRVGISSKWTRDLEVLVPFQINPKSFQHYSFIDVLENNSVTDAFDNKTVLVGIEATGLEPKFLAPYQNNREMLSGTAIQANLYSALSNSTLLTPILSIWGVTYAVLMTSLLYSILFFLARFPLIRRISTVTCLGVFMLPVAAVHYGYWLPIAPAFGGVSLVFIMLVARMLNQAGMEHRNDNITDLSNHRMFEETLQLEWEQSLRKHTPLSLILIEIDYFKRFIDTFGPERGDWLLARISPILQSHKRKTRDLVARYDDDTFAILLPITPNHIALSIAEKIRKDIEDLQIEHTGSDSAKFITVSAGITTLHVTSQSSPNASMDAVVLKSLKALSKAQLQGGNCIYNSETE